MIKEFISKNLRKISIIGIVLIVISALIIAINNWINSTGTGLFKSNLNDTLQHNTFNGYLNDSYLGKKVNYTWSQYTSYRNLYCINHGNTYTGNVTVGAHYTVRDIRDISKPIVTSKTANGTTDVNSSTDIKFHIAMIHVMTEARNCYLSDQKRWKISYMPQNPTAQASEKSSDRYQRAIWAIKCYYYPSYSKAFQCTDKNEEGNYRDYAMTARRAINLAEYTLSRIQSPPTNKTNMNTLTYKNVTHNNQSYTVVGPYKITYPTVRDAGVSDLGTIKSINGVSGMYISDANGKEIGANGIVNNASFYIAIPTSARADGKEKTINFKFYKYFVCGNYYQLTTGTEYQDLVWFGDGAETVGEDALTLKIPGKTTEYEYHDAKFNVSWQKTDDEYNIINKETVFQYTKNRGEYNFITSDNGSFSIDPITIDHEEYSKLPTVSMDGKTYRVYEIFISEKTPPEGYERTTGNVRICTYFEEVEEKTEGNVKDKIKSTIYLRKCSIYNNSPLPIKVGDEIVTEDNSPKEINNINVTEYTIPNISITNKQIKKANYTLNLKKQDDQGNALDNAKFEIRIRGYEETEGVPTDIYNVLLSAQADVGKIDHHTENGGFLSSEDSEEVKKLVVSNINDIISITNTGEMKFELKDILYDGDIYMTITETEAPSNEYNKISGPIELCIKVEDGEIKSITNNTQEKVVITNNDNNTQTDIIATDTLITEPVGSARIIIDKESETGEWLSNVTFGMYNENNVELARKTTNLNGVIDAFKVEYKANAGAQEGQTLPVQKYIIKELSTPDGYIKFGDDESVEIEMTGIVKSVDNKLKVVTDSIKITNKTKQDFTYSIGSTTGVLSKDPSNNTVTISGDILNANIARLTIYLKNKKAMEGKYNFSIEKVDSVDSSKKVEGATFAVYDKEKYAVGVSNLTPITTGVTDVNGIANFEIPLTKKGTFSYIIKEIAAPDNYKILKATDYIQLDLTVDITAKKDADDNDYYEYEATKVAVYNMLTQSQGEGSRDIYVNGTKRIPHYSVYSDTTNIENEISNHEIDNVIDEDISGYAEGTSQETNEEVNEVTETDLIPADSKFESNSGVQISIVIPDDPIPVEGEYQLNFEKTNISGNRILGANFKLVSGNNVIDTSSLTNTGYAEYKHSITETDWSTRTVKYSLKEISAPTGYQTIEGTVDIEVVFDKTTTAYTASINVENNTNGTIKVNGNVLETGTTITVQNGNITVTIENEQKMDLALKKYIKGVTDNNGNYTDISTEREPKYDASSLSTTTEAKYRFGSSEVQKTVLQPVEVSNGNIVHYVIRVYNEGQSDGYASEIKDYLPNGVELAENSTINQQYGWVAGNNNSISTRYLENEKISKYDGGVTINSKEVEVELKVTEPDMYIGTLKNVAEISKMKDQDGREISQDVDSTANNTSITRTGETIDDKYNPTTKDSTGKYYDDVIYAEDDVDFEYIILKNPVLAGRIWLDVPPENTKDDINNIIDSHEILSGSETYRTLKENGGLTAILYKNGNAWKEIPVNEDGTYEVTVPKSDDGVNYNSYEVRFIYNGMDYTNVIKGFGDDNTKNSKAEESANERTEFNNKFGKINGQSDITYSSNSEKTISKYNITDNMKIGANTGIINLNINTRAEDLKHYNLGLKRRPTFDLALIKDVTSATVTINGQSETYTYDKFASYNPETESFETFVVRLRTEDQYNDSVNLGLRDDDRAALTSVVTTYSLRILNQSSTYGEATVVKDYYDNTIYDVNKVYIIVNDEKIDVAHSENNGVITITVPEHVLGNNQSYYVYVDLSVKSDKINELKDINKQLSTNNYAEICEYKTYTDTNRTSTPGIIDTNSAPDNYSNGFNENDTGKAPVIYIGTKDENIRTLSGNVFEDIQNADNININGVKVELVEIDANGNELRIADTQETNDGKYNFERFLPGNYIVRFRYGNDNKTVLTAVNGGLNEHSYNGQDYASTDYVAENYTDAYWYKSVTDKSDATDDQARRTAVNNEFKELTNYKALLLKAYEADTINQDIINELINKTNMFANTAKMTLSVEYGTDTVSSANIPTYNVSGIDFGLKKRPISEIELTKNVTKITLKSSSGETLVEAAPQRNGNSVQWMVNAFVKIEQEDSVLNGANLEVEYTLRATGVGEVPTKASMIVDYIDNNLRFESSDSNSGWQVIQASELQNKDDEKQSLVNNGIDLSKQQTIVVTTDNNPLETKLAKGQTVTSTITLTKTLTTSNSTEDPLSYNNIAEILTTENDEGRKTEQSTPGNLNPEDPNPVEPGDASAEAVSITNPTGQSRVYYVLGIAIAVIVAGGVIGIKKFVLDKKA